MTQTTNKIFRVTAHNTAPDSDNKIHNDAVARSYGFRGGLVPGVTVYGYMIPAVLERFGRDWLAHGSIAFRLHAPCYEGDVVVSRCRGQAVSAESEEGSLYASGIVGIGDNAGAATMFTLPPLPEMDQRPIASQETIVPGRRLGSIRPALDVTDESAIPERLLRMANEILMQNFRLGPWIHAGSEVRHHRLATCGQEITVSGVIQECFERKRGNFAVVALEMSGNDGAGSPRLVATVRHTFIYDLRRA
jgi:acyl dehydratase